MTDDELIRLLEERDESALVELERKYYPFCRAVAEKILDDPEDVKEVVNDSFFDIWNSIPPAKPDNFHAYLATVVRHNAISLYRKNHNQKNQAVSNALPLDDFADRHCTDDNTVERIAISGAMDRFLDGLAEKQRLVFIARFYKHEPINEIARIFKMPSGSVKSIIHRTKKALKEFLDKEGINV
ncbi:MAG: sigma-70 family RNA polymerase sigma factor [Clostridia bacterium]|nr:sigma-70 family RNA polymerase sigma factor [Clostridia bacterium]